METTLDKTVELLKSQTFATSTKACYKTHRDTFLAFCKVMCYTAVPASSQTLSRYIALLSQSLKYNSIKQYLNCVRILHLELGYANPLENNFQIKCILRGTRRILGDTPCRKSPITPDILKGILSQLDLTNATDSNFWAACLTLFFGLLRRANVLPQSRNKFNTDKHLRRQDITFHSWGVNVCIRWTKTLQFNERQLNIPLPRNHKSPLCPVQAIFHAFKCTPTASQNGPAFCITQDQPLTLNVFVSRLRECLQACGLNPELYAGHSFRRGGASWAFSCGVNADLIKLIGDWRSSCYTIYLSPPRHNIYDAVNTMLSSIDK